MNDHLDLLPEMLAEVPELDEEAFGRLAARHQEQIAGSAPGVHTRRSGPFFAPMRFPARRLTLTRRAAAIAFVGVVVAGGVTLAQSSGRPGSAAPKSWPAYILAVENPTRDRTELIPFDPTTGRVGKPIPVPYGASIAPGGRRALSLDGPADLAYPVNLENGHVGRPIEVGAYPVSVAFTADGKTAYVADAGQDACFTACGPGPAVRPSDEVTPVNLITDQAGPPIHVCPGPMQVAMAPSGKTLLVACYFGGVDAVSTSTNRVTAHYDVPGSPGNFAFADGGGTVLVGQITVEDLQSAESSITSINLTTGRVGKTIVVGKPGGTSVEALAPGGIAYVNTWGRPIPPSEAAVPGARNEYTSEIVPLDLRTGKPGNPVAVPGSNDPVAAVGYWPGLGVRYLLTPDLTGTLVEFEPGQSAAVVIRTGSTIVSPTLTNFYGIIALDPNTPLAIVRVQLPNTAGGAFGPIKVVDLTTGAVGPKISLPSSTVSISIEFDGVPVLNGETPTWPNGG